MPNIEGGFENSVLLNRCKNFPKLAIYPLIKSTYNLCLIYAIKLKNAIIIDDALFCLFHLSQRNRDKTQTGIPATTKQICLQFFYASIQHKNKLNVASLVNLMFENSSEQKTLKA